MNKDQKGFEAAAVEESPQQQSWGDRINAELEAGSLKFSRIGEYQDRVRELLTALNAETHRAVSQACDNAPARRDIVAKLCAAAITVSELGDQEGARAIAIKQAARIVEPRS